LGEPPANFETEMQSLITQALSSKALAANLTTHLKREAGLQARDVLR
jgi:hypothetical protein